MILFGWHYCGPMDVTSQARAAQLASHELARATRAVKDAALHAMADRLTGAAPQVLEANAKDVARVRESGTAEWMIDRLSLTPRRIEDMVAGLRSLAALPDPIGEVVRGWNMANGAHIDQVRVPMGVIGIIYEARPNVTADAAGICVKTGNACLLRGSSHAIETNRVVVEALRAGLVDAGLPEDSVALVEGGHEVTDEMMAARGLIDLLIPRGGAGLINAVVQNSKVPVIETGTGNCHLFVDESADQQMAVTIALNAKTQRPTVCNALETMLVHRSIAETFIPVITEAMTTAGVTIHGDEASRALDERIVPAGPDEYDGEYLSLDLAMKVVDDIDAAIDHIRAHTTGHSETIITSSAVNQRRFTTEVDAAVVLVNASSRFSDGGEFGFGAEIGISTQKMHARGPMGLAEMTSTKYVVTGSGQVRA